MFASLNNLIDTIFIELRTLGLSIFSVGILVLAILTAFGGEENKRNFQRGLIICIFGVIVFVLAKPIITFIRTTL